MFGNALLFYMYIQSVTLHTSYHLLAELKNA